LFHPISVIVPAYNAAKRISETVAAITAQNFGPLEIIVVDDGSDDGTADTALSGLRGGNRKYRIIRLPRNMGVSAARNEGLRAASGDYVIFMDADDVADPDFISILYEVIARDGGDLAFCGYRYRLKPYGEERPVNIGLDPSRTYSGEDIAVMFIRKKIHTSVCAVLFRKSFLDSAGLLFSEGCVSGEDVEFLTKAFSLSDHTAFAAKYPYVYVHHGGMGSASAAASPEKRLMVRLHRANALLRTAMYLKERAPSPVVRDLANHLLLPEARIKLLTVAAMRNDPGKFNEILNEPETRPNLRSSGKYAFRRPEVFLKALCLLTFPGMYFRARAGS
jgi:glycosyltransferase involved in cell wall biosynthesis